MNQTTRQPLVTITGASGTIGRQLAVQLLRNGVKVRAVARHAETLAPLRMSGAEAYVGDLEDLTFLTKAFRGVDAVFAMLPEHPYAPDFQTAKHRIAERLSAAVQAANVSHVVALSAIGVIPPSGIGPVAANGAFEDMLMSIAGLSVVALRSTFLMENHLAAIPLIKMAGINGSPVRADVMLPMVATRDIAAVAANYLMKPTFDGYQVHELLGPRDYTYGEATAILGAAIGKPDLAYVKLPYADFHNSLVGVGFSENAADALVALYTAFNDGHVQRMTHRTPANTTSTTLETFASEVFAPAYGGTSDDQ